MGASSSSLDERLDGKTVVVTGGNTGIGLESCKDFFKRGAKVIMICRNIEAGEKAIGVIENECKDVENVGSLTLLHIDLSSLQSVRECADKLLKSTNQIDILLNNAGVMACPHMKTKEGFEMQFGTNHLGHFLLTLLLMPKIMQSDRKPARIVNVSSLAHKGGKIKFQDIHYENRKYTPAGAYMQSKLANILFTKELAKRIEDAGLTDDIHTYSLHPGMVNTELLRHLGDSYFKMVGPASSFIVKHFGKTPPQGAQTQIHCCVSEKAGRQTGLYYSDSKVASSSSKSRSVKNAERLWKESLKMCGLPEDFDPFVKET